MDDLEDILDEDGAVQDTEGEEPGDEDGGMELDSSTAPHTSADPDTSLVLDETEEVSRVGDVAPEAAEDVSRVGEDVAQEPGEDVSSRELGNITLDTEISDDADSEASQEPADGTGETGIWDRNLNTGDRTENGDIETGDGDTEMQDGETEIGDGVPGLSVGFDTSAESVEVKMEPMSPPPSPSFCEIGTKSRTV